MTASHAAPAPSIAESEAIRHVRAHLHARLPSGIPADLDTPLQLLRWLRGHGGDLDAILYHFREYVSSREAAGFVGDDFPQRFLTRADISQYLPYTGHCCLLDSVWSDEHNAFLLVERAWAQPKELIRTLKTSDYLMHCFGYSEMLQQLILKREQAQPSCPCPVQFIVIFDLSAINVTDYLNPSAGYLKLWQLRAEMWQNWFPDTVQRVFIVNPPRMANVLWKLTRLFINERNSRIVEVVNEGSFKELARQLPRHFLPAEFGGEFVNDRISGADESGCAFRKRMTSLDHYKAMQHYKTRGATRARPSHKDLMPHEVFRLPIAVLAGQSLCWDFLSSGELDFHIYTNGDEFDMVFPRLRLATPKLPEEGALDDLPTGEYVLQFSNPHALFTVRLDYSITLAGSGVDLCFSDEEDDDGRTTASEESERSCTDSDAASERST